MKNPLFLFLTILGAVCAGACIILIVLIVMNGNNRNRESLPDEAIPLPERFRQLSDTIISTPDPDTVRLEPPPVEPPAEPAYTGTITCKTMVPAPTLKQLLTRRNLVCKKSQWSKQWANPSGKGIRLQQEGLTFNDSIVIDSITRRMWQRHSTSPKLVYKDIDAAITRLNTASWQEYRDWRTPTVEELMALLTPGKNRHGLYLPGPWDSRVRDYWSCNSAVDSLSVEWIWVVRAGLGRCNHGHPDMPRALLAVREY